MRTQRRGKSEDTFADEKRSDVRRKRNAAETRGFVDGTAAALASVMFIATMTAAELLLLANVELQHDNLVSFLSRASELATENKNPSLAMLLIVLADMPSEAAAAYALQVADLGKRLHPDSDLPTICDTACRALLQYTEGYDPDPMGGEAFMAEACGDMGDKA